MNLYIYDEGAFSGSCVFARDANEAADFIIANEEFPVEDIEGYKREILLRLKRLPVAYGIGYRFKGEES